ncbi:MAG: ABC transporter ATP-binding protein [Arachnia sp.]
MNAQPAIQTHGLCKTYGSFPAVVDLDLTIRRGEIFGFLGPNGAGKSTTIRTLMDEIRPTAGSATMLGLDVHRDAVELHTRVGYLPSDVSLYPKLTGRETLTFFANLRGGHLLDYAMELVERLDAELDKRVGELSTGNRQKIGLVVTFMHRPELLIMDEPNAGLDPLVQHEFHSLLRETAAEGRTVFLSSHTLSEVERVADRVGIIRRGRLAAVEDVAALRAKMIRRITMVLGDSPMREEFEQVSGVRDVAVDGKRVSLSFDGNMEDLLAVAMRRHDLHDIATQEADLEEVFLAFYQDEDPS